VCADFDAALELLRSAGLRLDVIYPADSTHTALLTYDGRGVRLTASPDAEPISETLPSFEPAFVLTRAEASGEQGRAGMLYRDLIPDRLGGRYIASHITIPDGGPVADWVHFHRIALQIIYVRSGWVRVVYEDQGEPFVMRAGDLVVQPPEIRHRVLESSAGLKVVEISCPALHETFADHQMELPNAVFPERKFGAQLFLHHVAAETPWTPFGGGEAQDTGVAAATGGVAEARAIRSAASPEIAFAEHAGELVFGFVLDGSATLHAADDFSLNPADAFVIPPGEAWQLNDMSADFRLLHVTTAMLGQDAA
jgi:quercetin dioxygenase-like cupin family protein